MLTFGKYEFDESTLPAKSTQALLARGYTHYLGNEQASKLVGKIKSAIAGKDGKAGDVTREQVVAFRKENEAQVTAWNDELIQAALKALSDGSVGQRATGAGLRGQVRSPLEAARQAIARSEVLTILKSRGIKVPKGDQTITFGNGETRTMPQMIARRIELHAERIEAEAKKQVAAQERKHAAVAKEASSAASTEELGI
ncbi:MAG: hypothetical protein KGI89_17525 [Euryarchaeota archaeon]|nr:hypothetical protein [Euryarchaeota archaeon]